MLCAVDPKQLRLSKQDDQIYKRFREVFPDLNVDTLDEDKIKSKEGKDVKRINSILCLTYFLLCRLGDHFAKNFVKQSTIIITEHWFVRMLKENIQVKIHSLLYEYNSTRLKLLEIAKVTMTLFDIYMARRIVDKIFVRK